MGKDPRNALEFATEASMRNECRLAIRFTFAAAALGASLGAGCTTVGPRPEGVSQPITRHSDNVSRKAVDLVTSAGTLLRDNRIAEAEGQLNEALALASDSDTRATALLLLASVLIGRGELDAAQDKAQEAVGLSADPQLREGASLVLGFVFLNLGLTTAAEERFLNGSRATHPDSRAGAFLGLAMVRIQKMNAQGRPRPTTPSDDVSVSTSSRLIRQRLESELTASWRSHDPSDIAAVRTFAESALNSAQAPDLRVQASALLAMDDILSGRRFTARRILRSALSEAGASDQAKSRAHLAFGLAALLEADYREAVRQSDRALAPFTKAGLVTSPATIEIHSLRALALALLTAATPVGPERQQVALAASEALRRAVGVLNETRSLMRSTKQKMLYFASPLVQTIFGGAASVQFLLTVVAEGRPADGLELVELGRARVLLEQLAKGSRGELELPRSLREKERRLRSRVIEFQQTLTASTSAGDGLRRELASARRELNTFVNSLRQNPEPDIRAYAVLTYSAPPRVEDIHRALRKDEVLIEYKVAPDATFIWVVRKERPVRMLQVPVGAKALREQVTTLRDVITRSPSAEFDLTVAHVLYNLLLKEALADLPEATSLIIVPDDVLLLLPFEALVIGFKDTTAAYLGEKHPVRYYPSAGTLVMSRENTKGLPKWVFPLLALADPLISADQSAPGSSVQNAEARAGASSLRAAAARGYRFLPLRAARREVEEIATVLHVSPHPPHVLIGEEATKVKLLQRSIGEELWRYRFIHLATHGVLGADVPGLNQPALLLGADQEGGEFSEFLTMDEISRLSLSADLVVLSACQTGLGEEVAGEGVLGLTRAVLQAGAASVVASLWNVADEATATFMARFYSYLVKDGLDKGRALQRTKRDFLRQSEGKRDTNSGGREVGPRSAAPLDRTHPFFWAPFILVGED